jgi:hypothetical protein
VYSIPGVRLCRWFLPSNDVTAWIITSTPPPPRGPCSVFVDSKHRDYCTYRLHQHSEALHNAHSTYLWASFLLTLKSNYL